jgi:hypothetical protein
MSNTNNSIICIIINIIKKFLIFYNISYINKYLIYNGSIIKKDFINEKVQKI